MSAIIRYPNVRLKWYHKVIYKLFGNPYKDALDQYCEEVKDLGKDFDVVNKELDEYHTKKKLKLLLDPPKRVGDVFYIVLDSEYKNVLSGKKYQVVLSQSSKTSNLNLICVMCEIDSFILDVDKTLVCTMIGDHPCVINMDCTNIFFDFEEAKNYMANKNDPSIELLSLDDSIHFYKVKSK